MKKIDKAIFKDVTLLYVEDDPMTLEEISFFLKKYVKKLYIAKNGKEGLELFKEHSPDMIITDVQMPIMNGLEMSEKILELNPNIPIAITTAYSDGDYLVKAIALGIDKYLLKPIDMLEMLAVIQKSLSLDKDKKIKGICDDYIQFILDSNPTFMFILHADKVEYANKKFLELLGHEDIVSLKEHIDSTKDVFEFENIQTDENWMDYILNNSQNSYLVRLNHPNFRHRNKFYVTYKYFESTNKSIFVFVDSYEEKLNRIDDIVKDILDKENLEDSVLEQVRKISTLTRG